MHKFGHSFGLSNFKVTKMWHPISPGWWVCSPHTDDHLSHQLIVVVQVFLVHLRVVERDRKQRQQFYQGRCCSCVGIFIANPGSDPLVLLDKGYGANKCVKVTAMGSSWLRTKTCCSSKCFFTPSWIAKPTAWLHGACPPKLCIIYILAIV